MNGWLDEWIDEVFVDLNTMMHLLHYLSPPHILGDICNQKAKLWQEVIQGNIRCVSWNIRKPAKMPHYI